MHFENNAVNKTEIKNVHSQSMEMNFGASDSNNSCGTLIISKYVNSLVFQLCRIREEQHKINSFQFVEHRTLADVLGFRHAAHNGAV